MSEEFKLEFREMPSGLLRADFKDYDGEACMLKESNTKQGVWFGLTDYKAYLNRDMARVLSMALIRFANRGTLAEPTPEEAAELDSVEMQRLDAELSAAQSRIAELESDYEIASCDAYRYSTNAAELELEVKSVFKRANSAESALEEARRTAEYWKAERNACSADAEKAEAERDRLRGVLRQIIKLTQGSVPLVATDVREMAQAALEGETK